MLTGIVYFLCVGLAMPKYAYAAKLFNFDVFNFDVLS
ncbi:hypothetical protein Pse7367_2554 [Thalassoporum mexicanum PCC 7367]|nr:hypothetical protein Pse7367_2554 [Pseudanabaena sp. PCC 7367]